MSSDKGDIDCFRCTEQEDAFYIDSVLNYDKDFVQVKEISFSALDSFFNINLST